MSRRFHSCHVKGCSSATVCFASCLVPTKERLYAVLRSGEGACAGEGGGGGGEVCVCVCVCVCGRLLWQAAMDAVLTDVLMRN